MACPDSREHDGIIRMINKPSRAMLKHKAACKERILQEIECIAFMEPMDFYNDDWSLKELSEIPEEARRSLSMVDIKAISEGKIAPTGYLRTLKAHNKQGALDMLCKWHGCYAPEKKDVTQNTVGATARDLQERIALLTGDPVETDSLPGAPAAEDINFFS